MPFYERPGVERKKWPSSLSKKRPALLVTLQTSKGPGRALAAPRFAVGFPAVDLPAAGATICPGVSSSQFQVGTGFTGTRSETCRCLCGSGSGCVSSVAADGWRRAIGIKRGGITVKRVGRCVERPRGPGKQVPNAPWLYGKASSCCWNFKGLPCALLSFQLRRKAKGRKTFPVSMLPGVTFTPRRKAKGVPQPCWNWLPAPAQDTNGLGLNMSTYGKK